MEDKHLQELKSKLILELEKRTRDKILENENKELLSKLIQKADSQKEALDIMALGTTYKRTGFHFDKRLEQSGDKIFYLKKNEDLSFSCDFGDFTKENKQSKEAKDAQGITQKDEFTTTPLKHTLIIGDNYPALQNLLITYKKKIKVIYIDPPYGKDDLGEFAKTNYHNAITRDNLLSMLYPRLQLAKELLKDDGVIFCSIDDRNQAYVKCLFDEVFGEENFVANFIWEKTQHFGRQKVNFYSNSEYIICYAKKLYSGENKQRILMEKIQTEFDDAPLYNASNNKHILTFPKNSCSFKIDDGIYELSEEQEKYELLDSVIVKNGTNQNTFRINFKSRWSNETLQNEIKNGAKVLIKSKKFSPRMIYAENKTFIVSPKTLIFTNKENPFCATFNHIKVGTNENGSSEVKSLLGKDIFEYPKPTSLLTYLIGNSTTSNTQATKEQFTPPPPQPSSLESKDSHITDSHKSTQKTTPDIILDFFAGSGTTGHAVLELNREDNGNRQFILVTNNEITDLNPNGIAKDVTSKRLKRIMSGQCYDKSTNFKWREKNAPYGGILEVFDIAEVSEYEKEKGKSAFEVIDEANYGLEPFQSVSEKIKWVCENFDGAKKTLQMQDENDRLLDEKEWEERLKNGNITGS